METNYALAFNVHRIYTYTLKQCVSPLAQSTPGTAFYTLGIPFQSKGWEKQLPGKQTCQPGLCGQLRAINQVFCFLHSLLGSYHLSWWHFLCLNWSWMEVFGILTLELPEGLSVMNSWLKCLCYFSSIPAVEVVGSCEREELPQIRNWIEVKWLKRFPIISFLTLYVKQRRCMYTY